MTCEHDWKNDPMFEDDAVMMITSMNGEEMRQGCMKCGQIQYIPKKASQNNDKVKIE